MNQEHLKLNRVLIVDDQEPNVRVLEALLAQGGYTDIHSTTDSRQVLDLFQTLQPDLLLLDLLMPHFDGFAILHQLRALLPAEGYLPILVLTADITSEAKHRALKLGATDFLTKPFDAAEVLLRIHNLLHTRFLHRQLQDHNLLLEQKVAERTQQLVHARDAALDASRLKSEFLQTISHELRTPLAQVIGINQLLLTTPLDEEQTMFAGIVEDSSQNLLRLIDSILDFTNIESGNLALNITEFEPRTMFEAVLLPLESGAREKGIHLYAEITESVPCTMRGDMRRLQQIMQHLLSNAVKFTEQGEVEVRVMIATQIAKHPMLHVTVRDTGMGLSDTARLRLFQPFSQADGSMTRRHGGVGLSLAITKRLVERMGGMIGVESVAGQGSTFWFTIQLEPAAQMSVDDAVPDEYETASKDE